MQLLELMNKLRLLSSSKREQGTAFEYMMATYLMTDPLFESRFEKIFLWRDWPDRPSELDTGDIGIDLVGVERDGGYCAIQCKFFEESKTISKEDLDSFLSLSSKEIFTARLIISTSDRWGDNALKVIANQRPAVQRIGLSELINSPIDWVRFDPDNPDYLPRQNRKSPLPHQLDAISAVKKGFEQYDRGKLIMACGTGKTFTSLKLAEEMAGPGGHVLFLVPSIALLSQALREWTTEVAIPLQCMAICSDTQVTKESEDMRVFDLALPATTDPVTISQHLFVARQRAKYDPRGEAMYVVFSTYQSLDIIRQAQKDFSFPRFDLVICDEAHRTAGVSANRESSSFLLVHNDEDILADKRLYMTATPKIFADSAKKKADEAEVELYSMDNVSHFGPEFYRLGFGKAVDLGLLSDYKVLILALDEAYAASQLRSIITSSKYNIALPDAAKLLGCWIGLAKISDRPDDFSGDPDPMRTGVVFVNKITDSKQVRDVFGDVVREATARGIGSDGSLLPVEIQHIDGGMGALVRNRALDWLREESNQCRLLTNAKCLSEGIDVPSLDAVMFLQPKKSQIEVVQAVGRVMRKAADKKLGYIILPIVVSSEVDPDEALDNNKEYAVIWEVLQALKAHDERFEAIVNQVSFSEGKSDKIDVIGVGGKGSDSDQDALENEVKEQLSLWPEKIEQALYARISKRLSNTRYWPRWAEDVARLAEIYRIRIKEASEHNSEFQVRFEDLLQSLQENINPSLNRDDAIDMLSQHLITKPVFDALFSEENFIDSNPVSRSLESVVEILRTQENTDAELKFLDDFYDSVRKRASEARTREDRQQLIKDLYQNFFNTALKKATDRMGIAYTPVEIVDFILNSCQVLANRHFGVDLSDDGIHILDPFAGTGTFISRFIELGLVGDHLERKYKHELHANEILLLPYYISSVNIESSYHYSQDANEYIPFEGMVLTDTFQTTEHHEHMGTPVFRANSERIERQRNVPITVVVGNPPYSGGQKSQNDNAKNIKYENLDNKIRATYTVRSEATLQKQYDSYIRAFRWASDRIGDGGIVAFVTNGSWLKGQAGQGIRASFEVEFDAAYVVDLRGDQRTSGVRSKLEGGKIFGISSRVPVTVVFLVKGQLSDSANGIFYHDIGDALTREEKLAKLCEFGSVDSIPFESVVPNIQHDWVGQRDQSWENLYPLAPSKSGKSAPSIFSLDSNGLVTNRDAWIYNSSKSALTDKVSRMIDFYNDEVRRFVESGKPPNLDSFVDPDEKKISWSVNLKMMLKQGKSLSFGQESLRIGLYRPFFKEFVYFNRQLNERVNQLPQLYPLPETRNPTIITSGRGAGVFSVLATNLLSDLNFFTPSHVFARQRYEKADASELFGEVESGWQKIDNITDEALEAFRNGCRESELSKDDLFAYAYGVLNHPEYQERYQNNLTKEYPRLPWLENHREYIEIGQQLLDLHINYESVEPYPLEERFSLNPPTDQVVLYRAVDMKHPSRKSGKRGKEDWDRTRIVVNPYLTLDGVPEEASLWMLGGRPALELFLDRMKPKTDAKSGIRNDPNDFSDDPKYVVELTKKVVKVCIETCRLHFEFPEYTERALLTEKDFPKT